MAMTLRSRGPRPTPGSQAYGSRAQREFHVTFGENQQRLWLSETEGCWSPRHSCRQTYLLTHSLALNSRARAAAPKAPGTYKEKLNCLGSGRGLEGQLCLGRHNSSCMEPSPHPACRSRWVGAKSESPSTCLTLFTTSRWFPETLPHPTCWPPQDAFRSFSIQTTYLSSCYRLS